MAYGGTPQHAILPNGSWHFAPGFDADAEELIIDVWRLGSGHLPSSVSMIIQTTAGVTALISFKLQGSIDNNTYTDLLAVTAKDTEAHFTVDYTSATGLPVLNYRYFKLLCVTVGAANTLAAYLILKTL